MTAVSQKLITSPFKKFGTLFPVRVCPIPLLELIKTALQTFLCVLRVIKSPQVTRMDEFHSERLNDFLPRCSLPSYLY